MKESFGNFLGRNCWLLLISFVHMLRTGENFTGSKKLLTFFLTSGIIILLMFFYWNYQNKNN